MSTAPRPVFHAGLLLGIIALLGVSLLALVNDLTRERIIEQEERRVLRQLNEIVPQALYDNALHEDVMSVTDPVFFRHSTPVTVFRARKGEQAIAAIMRVTAPDGYNGDIRLLVGIDAGGTILGVRVVSHRETPGLGDPIETRKSDWVLGFADSSLQNPDARGWTVKKDGGHFDQFTGATISPRAVVRAVHTALIYFQANRQQLFDTPAATAADQ